MNNNYLKVLEQNFFNCSWPALYYDKVQSIVGLLNPSSIIEIGVAYGYHAKHLLQANKNAQYYGIDPYRADYDESDPFVEDVHRLFNCSSTQNSMDKLYSTVIQFLEPFKNRATLIREDSSTAADKFDAESIDVIFLDGDHNFRQVLLDLRSWWPIIKSGGMIIGDDFAWPEVRQAVNIFFSEISVEFYLLASDKNDHVTFFAKKN